MLVKCKDCKGKRYIEVKQLGGLKVSCATCGGKGGFDVPENKELCPECNGRKKVNVPTGLGIDMAVNCERCFGTGFIDKE